MSVILPIGTWQFELRNIQMKLRAMIFSSWFVWFTALMTPQKLKFIDFFALHIITWVFYLNVEYAKVESFQSVWLLESLDFMTMSNDVIHISSLFHW